MTKKTKRRGPLRWGPLRFTARLHLDIVDAAGRVWDAAKATLARLAGPPRPTASVPWQDAPLRSLVLAAAGDLGPATGSGLGRLFVRSTADSGAFVGVLDPSDGTASCDDTYEHESWSTLGRRRGAERVYVLTRRVKAHATAAELESLAARAAARIDGAS